MHRQTLKLDPEELRIKLESLNCIIATETSLRTRPESIHWHIKHRTILKGTLEATWMKDGQSWLSYHANRYQPWIDEIIEKVT